MIYSTPLRVCTSTVMYNDLITSIRNKRRKKITVTRRKHREKLGGSILAVPLVGPVATIVHPVALHSLRNASVVLARELVLVAPSLTAVGFVGSVEAVRQTIAEAGPQYALAVAARELVLRRAGPTEIKTQGAVNLISSVPAIYLAIAFLFQQKTGGLVTALKMSLQIAVAIVLV